MRSEDVEYTRFGNKKGPSYQQLIDMCSAAWHSHDKDIVRASFVHTGVTNTGKVDYDILHSKLRMLMKGEEGPCMEEDQEKAGLTDYEEEEEESDDEQLPDI